MKLDRLLKNNTFLISSGVYLIILLTICYLGLNSPVKTTYSASTCNGTEYATEDGIVCHQDNYLAGKWEWNNDEISFPGYDNGNVSIDWGTYSGGMLESYANDVISYGANPPSGILKDYKLNFTSNGINYQSLAILKSFTESSTHYVYYDTSYSAPDKNTELAPVSPNLYDQSEAGRNLALTLSYKTPVWSNEEYKIINFGTTPQSVPSDFYNWFTTNAKLVTTHKCYYNESENKFTWTDKYVEDMKEYSIYTNESDCLSNASMKLTIKSNYPGLQDCSSGTCGDKANEITLNLLPGTYRLNDTEKLKYNISKPGHILYKWIIKTRNGSTYGSGYGKQDANSELIFNNISYAWTIEAELVILIDYDANNGKNAPSGQIKTEGTTLQLSSTIPTRDGYKFTGWNTKADGTGTNYNSGDKYSDDKSITLYAQWKIEEYTVTFDSAGGSSVASQTVEYGGKATKPSNPTRSGYTFSGWTLNGSTYDFSTAVTGNITLVAKWTPNVTTYKVTFNGNGGTAAKASVNVESGKETTLPTATRDGFDFTGWYTSSTGGTKVGGAGENYTVTKTITLYAQWKEQEVSIDFGKYKDNVKDDYIIVDLGTKKTDFEGNIKFSITGYKASVEDKDGLLYTSGKLKILKSDNSVYKEYIIVVLYDLSADGALTTMDYMVLYRYLADDDSLSINAETLKYFTAAADINKDGTLTTMDYMLIYEKLKGVE